MLFLFFLQIVTIPFAKADFFEDPWTKELKGTRVEGVIDQWGGPSSVKEHTFSSKIDYLWKRCYKTGVIISQCNYGNCKSWPEYTCCFQNFVTDKNKVIIKYEENSDRKGNACIDLNLKQAKTVGSYDRFGSLYIKDEKTRNMDWLAGYSNEKNLSEVLNSNCQGKCVETFFFKNSCAAVVEVGNKRVYYYAADENPKVAVDTALKKCKDKEGDDAECVVLTPDMNGATTTHVCADLVKQKEELEKQK